VLYIEEHIHRPFVFAFIIIITITKVLVVAIVQAVIKI